MNPTLDLRSVLGDMGRSYQPLPGVHDEMVDGHGQVRPHWLPLLGPLVSMGGTERKRAYAVATRHLRESGVFYRVHDEKGGGERPWPLNQMPLVLSAHEWKKLRDGVTQRATLMERVVADIYGENRLVKEGVLPPSVIAGHRDYLRPMAGLKPGGGRYLRVYAVDMGRGPGGEWWVLSDRTQAPSGMGYTVENRLALSRAFPDLYRQLRVERLAGFFTAFREELTRLNVAADARVAILSPGPYSETYFEHAYLARYLGFLLVEGEDLVVRDDVVHVRTISGLRRIDVLYRRLDSDFADPLELAAISRLGVPGMVRAVRAGNLVLANALGSGVLENRALLGFVPRIARSLLGEDLLLPNIATWWCGQEAERRHVAENLDQMVLAPAQGGALGGFIGGSEVLGSNLGPAEQHRLRGLLDRRGYDVVGQEVVKISTMPAWINGALVPRPFVLRLYAVATGEGWTVLPGGFCRISDKEDARAVSLQQGAHTADVWVLSEQEVERSTLIPAPDTIAVRRQGGALPSRSADNLFWLSRNLERAEGVLRLVRALAVRAMEFDGTDHRDIDRMVALLTEFGALPEEFPGDGADAVITALTGEGGGSVAGLSHFARQCASAIRDRLAPDAWMAVTSFADSVMPPTEPLDLDGALERSREALHILSSFAGLSSENMIRRSGWRFLELGRRIERGVLVSRYARALAPVEAGSTSLDLLLELCDCQIAYRSLYPATARVPALDLLVLDPNNPRSVAGQAGPIVEHLLALPVVLSDGRPTKPLRLARRFAARLANDRAEDLADTDFGDFIGDLHGLANSVAARFFIHRRGAIKVQEDAG